MEWSSSTLNNQRAWVRQLIDMYFPDAVLRADQVQAIRLEAVVVDFPRCLHCLCDRCRSPWKEIVLVGHELWLDTEIGIFRTWLPGKKSQWDHHIDQPETATKPM